MSDDTSDVRVRYDEPESAYLITVDGAMAGHASVTPLDDRMIFTHTEIDEAFAGRGLAKVLVREALADVAARGLAVEPRCGFVRSYLAKNPEAARVAV
ncbi:N-acetyltransferase [Actinotalea sp. M2MS4P-6]|uniref:GNAT family N-acetyltransferase n=1 Tax=Actinotalea sp. M2MS4P-6 TaxID=2983762 RepID=UPI0021E4DD2B|nr:GNAT family N-acetyltransferase [Actinotalea sp. M2MS4P-6]MCV2392977.1 N-acetyltransferase [Actinotalea sp. M2MS4P-6]